VYGAVVMNSTLCFGSFLAIIYARRLPWTFASEVAVILVPTLLLGAFAVRRRSWPAAWGLCAVALYPLALLLQWGLVRFAATRSH
jgi:Ca2+/Na+ antiporter